MDTTVVNWAGTLFCAKFFAGLARREFGLAPDVITWRRGGLTVDGAYLWLLAVFGAGVHWVGLDAALGLAILLRLSALLSTRALVAANHYFIELFAMVVFLRLRHTPLALAAAVQIMFVSTWLYAAFQKVYHGQFMDGSFFYILFQDSPSHRWPGMVRWVGRLTGYYTPVDRAGQALCRRLAATAVVTEMVAPVVALMVSGTWWSVLTLAASSGAIAYMSGETSFMITNLALAALFFLPFDRHALLLAAGDPVVMLILCYYLLWPLIHAHMTRRLRISTWKLGGWGMYATTSPKVSLVGSEGEIATQATASVPLAALEAFGVCGISWLRRYVHRVFLRWHPDAKNVRGFLFEWYRRRGEWYVTETVICPADGRATPTRLVLADEASVSLFRARLASLRAASVGGGDAEHSTLDTQVSEMTCRPLPNCIIKEV